MFGKQWSRWDNDCPLLISTRTSMLVMHANHLWSLYKLLYLVSTKDIQALKGQRGVLRTPRCFWFVTKAENSNLEQINDYFLLTWSLSQTSLQYTGTNPGNCDDLSQWLSCYRIFWKVCYGTEYWAPPLELLIHWIDFECIINSEVTLTLLVQGEPLIWWCDSEIKGSRFESLQSHQSSSLALEELLPASHICPYISNVDMILVHT